MTLFQILLKLQNATDLNVSEQNRLNHLAIYATEPWTLESTAQLRAIDKNLISPIATTPPQVFRYFLHASTVKSLFKRKANQNLCSQAQCQLIIEFALEQRVLPTGSKS
ncbi:MULTISPECIES: hypothetical protein [unclassified Acinetobacter]|uniref:hypothetical protein n=1 Tax=unclassified Acinetobacter TaxID=196816 RepID=UPI0015D4167A|nr:MULTISPECIES: hypothetical protein [unclassified Acinetobacter]